jgi:hypothetical protein
MPRNLKRYYGRGDLHFVTFSCYRRGLVKNPGAWMWSSFLFYEKGQAGLITIDPVD